MKINDEGLNLIKEFEGCYLTAYKDIVGVWTIGYGITNSDKAITGKVIKSGLKISQGIAEEWLKKAIEIKYCPLVEKYNSRYNFNENEFSALVSFAYNVGSIDQLTANGTRSKEEIAEKFLAYDKAGGKPVVGLTRRRRAERALFLKPVSKKEVDNVFDADLYFSLYEDLRNAFGNNKEELYKHWLEFGIKEGRCGSYVFNADFYYNNYKDLQANIGKDNLGLYNHFKEFGIKEGRVASEFFDVNYYKNANGDLKSFSNKEALNHFVEFGIKEGRCGSEQFSVHKYREYYEDLRNAFKENWLEYYKHWITFGKQEGRKSI